MTVTTTPLWMQSGGEAAVQARRLTKAVFGRPGIINSGDFKVTALSTPAMKVQVAASSDPAIVAGAEADDQGYYAVWNDATVDLTVAASDSTNDRIDAVYIKVQDSEYSGTVDAASVVVVTGTAEESPVAPDAPTESHYLLATISVIANATSITNADITDKRTTAIDLHGSKSVSVPANDASVTFTVTFTIPFAAAPNVTTGLLDSATGAFVPVLSSVTASGISGVVTAPGGAATVAHTVSVQWHAYGQRA